MIRAPACFRAFLVASALWGARSFAQTPPPPPPLVAPTPPPDEEAPSADEDAEVVENLDLLEHLDEADAFDLLLDLDAE